MGRWGALAGRSGGDQTEDRPPTLEEFIEANHHLFTVISVFAALAVYLTKFQQASTSATRGAVGAVLILFMLTALVALRNAYRYSERARERGAYLLVFGYAIFMYSFVTLLVSVVLIIVGRYAQGAQNVLGSSFVYALVFIYVPFIFRADAFARFDGHPYVTAAIRRAPHLAALVLSAWYAVQWHNGTFPTLQFGDAAYAIGIVLGLIGNHFAITVGVFGALWVVNRLVTGVRG